MDLCQLCRAINVTSLMPDEEGNCYQHQPTYNALEISAQSCALCSIIFSAFETRDTDTRMPPNRPGKAEYAESEESGIWMLSTTYSVVNTVATASGSGTGISGARVNVGCAEYYSEIDLKISACSDDLLAINGDVVGTDTSSEPGSVESNNWVRNRFEDCERSHIRCSQVLMHPGPSKEPSAASFGPHASFKMPTRLIDVRTMKLWETQHQIGRYAALSYCWGLDRSVRFKTSNATYGDRLKGFSESDPPKSIRDAIILTRELGLGYLWVDALCIIQDNKSDWATESARMNEVYANATITIAAAAAMESKEGFFKKRDLRPQGSVSLTSKCSNGVGSGTMHISHKIGTVYEALDRSPLCQRGWTLQERVLSRRTIHFGKDQLYWECQQRSYTEGGLDYRDTLSITDFFSKTGDLTRSETFSDIRKGWERLIIEYSNRKIYDPFDKLPAFSGIAKEAMNRLSMKNSEYYAGLWKAELPEAFLWVVQPDGTRPAEWRAPSWSWASIEGRVISSSLTKLPCS